MEKKFDGSVNQSNPAGSLTLVILVLLVGTLACRIDARGAGTVSQVVRTRLPTLTPTRLPTLTPTPALNIPVAVGVPLSETPVNGTTTPGMPVRADAPDAVTVPTDSPSFGPTPVAVVATTDTTTASSVDEPSAPLQDPGIEIASESGGWSFLKVRTYRSDGNEFLLYGELVNNTGATQELGLITGTFFDGQGLVVADETDIFDIHPVDVVPPAGRIPFALEVDGIASATHANLRVEAEAIKLNTHQDFEFYEVNDWIGEGEYCVQGQLRYLGNAALNDLTLALVLYDNQDWVVNFENDYAANPAAIVGDQVWPFEICVDTLNHNVVRHELQALGL